ncbi:MAG: TusE/DsrC/DsvC family sulfur relay protein [Thermoleophilia bacterium]
MSVIEYAGTSISLDEDGYLENTEVWDESTARGMAENLGISELTAEMMDVIHFMRSYFVNYNSFPVLNTICKNVHQPKECVNEEFIDPLKAWKIAGLPNPGDEVISYLKR